MRNRTRDRHSGAAAVEMAVLLPFLLFLAVIATDWARMIYFTLTIDNCARNGALVCADKEAWTKSPYNTSQVPYPSTFPGSTAQQTVTTNAALGEAPSLVSGATASAASVADGGDGYPAVAVTVSMPFTTFTNFSYGRRFNVENSVTITRTVQMRIAPEATK